MNLDIVFSHSTGRPDTDLAAYALVTPSAARAATAAEVPTVVDESLVTAISRKRPVYVEIAMDQWGASCAVPGAPLAPARPAAGTEAALAATVVAQIRNATAPLVIIGVEIQRYGLADPVADTIARLGVRWSTALLAKSALTEQGAGWVGVFDPPHSTPAVTDAVDRADLIVVLGSAFPAGWAPLLTSAAGRIISAYDGVARVRGGARQPVVINALVAELQTAAAAGPPTTGPPAVVAVPPAPATGPLTYQQVFDRVGAALDDSWLTITDTFLGTFPAADLPVEGRDAFLSSAVWASIGHSVAASVGASFGSLRRPLVVCGDGGFHMTAQTMSTLAGTVATRS